MPTHRKGGMNGAREPLRVGEEWATRPEWVGHATPDTLSEDLIVPSGTRLVIKVCIGGVIGC